MERARRWQSPFVWVVIGLATVALISPLVSARGSQGFRLVYDDFRRGFSTSDRESKWNFFSFGAFVGSDGIASTGRDGLRVVSPGTNPLSGRPAFTLTVGPNSTVPGDLDHVKWLAFTNHSSTAGYPGFDTAPGFDTSCEAKIGATTYGTEAAASVFGASGRDRNSPYLAWAGLVAADFEKFHIFDFALTNDGIYALYERLPYGRSESHFYASYTYLVPVARRSLDDDQLLKITYSRTTDSVRWYINNKEVFRVDRIGRRLPDSTYLAIDRGGVDEDAGELRQLVCGMGTFTLLDGFNHHTRRGLVRLVTSGREYYSQPTSGQLDVSFVDESSTLASRLFDQGVEMRVRNMVVSHQRSR